MFERQRSVLCRHIAATSSSLRQRWWLSPLCGRKTKFTAFEKQGVCSTHAFMKKCVAEQKLQDTERRK